jgi:hypothetical protein
MEVRCVLTEALGTAIYQGSLVRATPIPALLSKAAVLSTEPHPEARRLWPGCDWLHIEWGCHHSTM